MADPLQDLPLVAKSEACANVAQLIALKVYDQKQVFRSIYSLTGFYAACKLHSSLRHSLYCTFACYNLESAFTQYHSSLHLSVIFADAYTSPCKF